MKQALHSFHWRTTRHQNIRKTFRSRAARVCSASDALEDSAPARCALIAKKPPTLVQQIRAFGRRVGRRNAPVLLLFRPANGATSSLKHD